MERSANQEPSSTDVANAAGDFFESLQPGLYYATERGERTGLFLDAEPPLRLAKLAVLLQTIGRPEIESLFDGAKEHLDLSLQDLALERFHLFHADASGPFEIAIVVSWHEQQRFPAKADQGFQLTGLRLAIKTGDLGTSAQFAASMAIHDVELDVLIDVPDLTLEAEMAQRQPGGRALRALVPEIDHKDRRSGPVLQSLRLAMALRQRHFLAHLEVGDLFEVGPFAFADCEVDLAYSGSLGGASKPSCRLYGRIDIDIGDGAFLPLFVEAEYQSETGWHFAGGSAASDIPVGQLVKSIARKIGKEGAELPDVLANLEIDELELDYDRKTGRFALDCAIGLVFGKDHRELELQIGYHRESSSHSYELRGRLQVAGLTFTIDLTGGSAKPKVDEEVPVSAVSEPAVPSWDLEQLLLASVADESGRLHVDIGRLLDEMTGIELIDSFDIRLKDAFFVQGKQARQGQPAIREGADRFRMAAVDLSANISLSNLPLIGKKLPKAMNASIDDLRLLFVSEDIDQATMDEVYRRLAAADDRLSAAAEGWIGGVSLDPATPEAKRTGAKKGLNIAARLHLGDDSLPLSLPTASGTSVAATTSVDHGLRVDTTSRPPDDTIWISVQRALGPIYLEKIGLRYGEEHLWVPMSASISLAGLTLDLDGLAVGSKLSKFDPVFSLDGLGIDFKEGPIELAGIFMHYHVKEETGEKDAKGEPVVYEYDEYDGMAVLRTPTLSLSVLGSYAKYHGHPSLFVYAALDYPLGGPVFFYIKGLAAGFGYNRRLIVPPLEKMLSFPLVAEAMPGAAKTSIVGDLPLKPAVGKSAAKDKPQGNPVRGRLMREIDALHEYIPPQLQQNFLTVGLHVSSFEIIDSFLMVAVQFGHPFEVDLMGLTSFSHPPGAADGVPALVRVEIVSCAVFRPDEGVFRARAILTNNSHLYDPNCHLTGGMALANWTKDQPGPDGQKAGEFVITIGGYHPRFEVPAAYPKVPRLGLSWRFNDCLSIKGGLYFAMTGHVLMAGGFLDAVWQSESLEAYIRANADLLIRYKPFHYEAEMRIEIGARVTIHLFGTHHISVTLSADLQVHGPEFGGKSKIHIWIASFTIHFGPQVDKPAPIGWYDVDQIKGFRNSFLPATGDVADPKKILGAAVRGGLVKSVEIDGKTVWIVNAKQLDIAIDSAIPITEVDGVDLTSTSFPKHFGIAPMDIRGVTSTLKVTLTNEAGIKVGTQDLQFEPITKNMPAGLWGNEFTPDVNGKKTVDGLLGGIAMRPQAVWPNKKHKIGETHPIDERLLAFSTTAIDHAFTWAGLDEPEAVRPTVEPASHAAERHRSLLHDWLDEDERETWAEGARHAAAYLWQNGKNAMSKSANGGSR